MVQARYESHYEPTAAVPNMSSMRGSGISPCEGLNALFTRSSGWTGGDGTYSIGLRDGRRLWLFGDTFVGTVQEGRRVPFGYGMLRNSVALESRGKLDFPSIDLERQRCEHLFVPPDRRGWFWPSDGVSAGLYPDGSERVLVFLNQFVRNTDPDYRFGRAIKTYVAELRVSGDGVEVQKYTPLPFLDREGSTQEGLFGSALFSEGGWTFIYSAETQGAEHDDRLMIARVPDGALESTEQWEFLTKDRTWTKDFSRRGHFSHNVGHEMSVIRVGEGLYALVGEQYPNAPSIRFARSPSGPWSSPLSFWDPPELDLGPSILAYGSKAHPELSDEEGLVISYNLNSLDAQESLERAAICRPRFIKISWTELRRLSTQARIWSKTE